MKLDLKLLAAGLSQLRDNETAPRDGVNDYLVDKILFPCMNGEDILLCDIDFDAFDLEDVDALANYYSELERWGYTVEQLAQKMAGLRPTAIHSRSFC